MGPMKLQQERAFDVDDDLGLEPLQASHPKAVDDYPSASWPWLDAVLEAVDVNEMNRDSTSELSPTKRQRRSREPHSPSPPPLSTSFAKSGFDFEILSEVNSEPCPTPPPLLEEVNLISNEWQPPSREGSQPRAHRVGLSYRCRRCGKPKRGHVCEMVDPSPDANGSSKAVAKTPPVLSPKPATLARTIKKGKSPSFHSSPQGSPVLQASSPIIRPANSPTKPSPLADKTKTSSDATTITPHPAYRPGYGDGAAPSSCLSSRPSCLRPVTTDGGAEPNDDANQAMSGGKKDDVEALTMCLESLLSLGLRQTSAPILATEMTLSDTAVKLKGKLSKKTGE